MRRTEVQDVIIEEGEIGRDHKGQILAVAEIPLLCLYHDFLDQVEVEQWLSALKLDLEQRGRRSKSHVQAAARRLRRHVKTALVLALPRDLAIGTRVFAPQGHDEDVKPRR